MSDEEGEARDHRDPLEGHIREQESLLELASKVIEAVRMRKPTEELSQEEIEEWARKLTQESVQSND